jgi:hypothetical protein
LFYGYIGDLIWQKAGILPFSVYRTDLWDLRPVENLARPEFSFHVNGEQHNLGFTNFKYWPFMLMGNFAFASRIQEMLIQSHTCFVEVFPAIPDTWLDASFERLRTAGAFLVSAKREAELQLWGCFLNREEPFTLGIHLARPGLTPMGCRFPPRKGYWK